MLNLKDIKDFSNVDSFTDGYYNYKKDNRARNSLNKTLETNYYCVYRENFQYFTQWQYKELDLSGETFYVVTNKGRVLKFFSSEYSLVKELG